MINGTGIEGITDPSLIYGTWALVIVTLIGIIITAILTKQSLSETKKSNNLYRLELEHRLKPDLRYAPENSNMKKDTSKLKLHGILNNEGQIEAYDVTISVQTYKQEPKIKEILKDKKAYEKSHIPIEGGLPPRQRTFQFTSEVDWDFSGVLFVTLWIKYKFFEESHNQKIYVLRCYGEPCEVVNVISNTTIERKEKELSKTSLGI